MDDEKSTISTLTDYPTSHNKSLFDTVYFGYETLARYE